MISFINKFFLILVLFAGFQVEAKNKFFLPPHKRESSVAPKGGIILRYYGGPIIAEVKVVSVNWSSDTAAIFVNEMPQFYRDLVGGTNLDWLSEYNTDIKAVDGREGTGQKFGRGQVVAAVTIEPSNKKMALTDAEIQAELSLQISRNILPRPDKDTLYMIHFPNKISIAIDGMKSCMDFGGYHYNVNNPQFGQIYYSVLPDCSSSSSPVERKLNSMTVVASHELMEAITDPQPTEGSNPAYPQAWNVSDGNEISDVCQYRNAVLTGTQRNYVVTTNWSNSRNTCYDGN